MNRTMGEIGRKGAARPQNLCGSASVCIRTILCGAYLATQESDSIHYRLEILKLIAHDRRGWVNSRVSYHLRGRRIYENRLKIIYRIVLQT